MEDRLCLWNRFAGFGGSGLESGKEGLRAEGREKVVGGLVNLFRIGIEKFLDYYYCLSMSIYLDAVIVSIDGISIVVFIVFLGALITRFGVNFM